MSQSLVTQKGTKILTEFFCFAELQSKRLTSDNTLKTLIDGIIVKWMSWKVSDLNGFVVVHSQD